MITPLKHEIITITEEHLTYEDVMDRIKRHQRQSSETQAHEVDVGNADVGLSTPGKHELNLSNEQKEQLSYLQSVSEMQDEQLISILKNKQKQLETQNHFLQKTMKREN